uniref:UspA domain-containing protein n=1 Tax=Zea mays TaxID=4577 RepID=A0A804NFH4_MAIZE
MATPAQQQGDQHQPRLQKVMVAVDESECSRHALEWALRNLAPTLAPPLLVLTVQPHFPLGYVSAASFGAPLGTVPPVAPELIRSMQEQQRELTQELLDKARAICAEHGSRF